MQDDLPPLVDSTERKSVRKRTLLAGRLIYGRNNFSMACSISDLTPEGARLRLPPGKFMPELGHLIDFHGRMLHAYRLAWLKLPHAGIAFTGRWPLDGALPPDLAGLRRIALEMAPR